MKSKISFLSLLFVLLSGCGTDAPVIENGISALPYYMEATFTPKWLNPKDEQLKDFHKIPNFQLYNQEGNCITEKTVEGKIYVVDFFFTTCPGICSKMTENMKLIQTEFMEDDEILLLSHSVTPETDTISTLNEYAINRGINAKRWHLLTGDRDSIYNLGRKAYFIEEDLGMDKNSDDFLHTENFVLVDKKRHIRGIYNGLNLTAIDLLMEDIKRLKKE